MMRIRTRDAQKWISSVVVTLSCAVFVLYTLFNGKIFLFFFVCVCEFLHTIPVRYTLFTFKYKFVKTLFLSVLVVK